MEIVSLLQKDSVEKKTKDTKGEAKVPLLEEHKKTVIKIGVPKIKRDENLLCKEIVRRQMVQLADKKPAIIRGAGWGACFGCNVGGDGVAIYYFGDGCVRLCCIKGFTFMETSLMNKIMCYALCGGTCAGCAIGATCVATGCSKDIDHYFA